MNLDQTFDDVVKIMKSQQQSGSIPEECIANITFVIEYAQIVRRERDESKEKARFYEEESQLRGKTIQSIASFVEKHQSSEEE